MSNKYILFTFYTCSNFFGNMFIPLCDMWPVIISFPQTAQTVLVVVVVFCLSWLPHHIVHLWVEFGSFPLNQASFVFRMVAHCLAYSNSSVNPIIYAFLSENFRNSYKQVFWCRAPSECPLNENRDPRSRMETAPSTNISVSYKGHDSQISKMLWWHWRCILSTACRIMDFFKGWNYWYESLTKSRVSYIDWYLYFERL